MKPSETTADAYRFEVNVAGNATEAFAVREERVFDQTISVTSLTPDAIAAFMQNKALSDAGRRQLEQIAQKKRDIAANDGQLRQAQADLSNLTQDEERQRRNIESLRNVAGQQNLVQQYAGQLAAAEVKLAALRDQESVLQKKKSTLESELNGLIEKAEF
jgi:chromosome segregation ATPase